MPVPLLLGVNDGQPSGFFDTMEGAYSGGAGSGMGMRIPIVRKYWNGWDVASSFVAGSRDLALFNAGHYVNVSYKPPAGGWADVANGSVDAAIDALGDRIYALDFGGAVSGSQPGVSYTSTSVGGPTKQQYLYVTFNHEMDNDTTNGTPEQFKSAHRRFFSRLKARRPTGQPERIKATPIFTATANDNGKAVQFYPGNTPADHVDVLGCDTYSPKAKPFEVRMESWVTWVQANCRAGMKIAVPETACPQTSTAAGSVSQPDYIASIVTALANHPELYEFVCWFQPQSSTSPTRIQKAVNAAGWQAFHDALVVAYAAAAPPADTTPPAVPAGLSAPTITGTTVTLAWNLPTDVDFAKTRISRDGSVIANVDTPTSRYTVSGQTAGTVHNYRVASVDTTGNVSAFSSPLSVTHPPVVAVLPPSIDSASVTPGISLDVTATATSTDPAGGTVAYAWAWGDGTFGSGSTATHDYPAADAYPVTLTVTSGASGLTASQTFDVTVQPAEGDFTSLGLALPVIGQRVGLFGTPLRGDINLLDELLTEALDRSVQDGDGPLQTRPPVTSYSGFTLAFEDPSDDYPKGRFILTAPAGGGGGAPTGAAGGVLGGSYPNPAFAVDMATQAELNTVAAAKLDVGYSDPGKVSIGTAGRSTYGLVHGFAAATCDPASSSNTTTALTVGSVHWWQMIAEVDATVSNLYFVVSAAGTGTGYTIGLHDSAGVRLKTGTGADTKLTGTGGSAVALSSSQAISRGSVYYVSIHVPSSIVTPPSLRMCYAPATVANVGLTAPNLRAASMTSTSAPTTLVLASGSGFTLAVIGAK